LVQNAQIGFPDRSGKAPAFAGAFLLGLNQPSEYRDVFQQRDHAEDDDDDARDLLGATIERQQVNQIENKNNDEKRNQYTHKHRNSPMNIWTTTALGLNAPSLLGFQRGNQGCGIRNALEESPYEESPYSRASETLETQSQHLGSQVTQFSGKTRAA
jgi:hypothetical protein